MKNWTPPCDDPTTTLTVTEISTSALECLVLQTETRLVRGGPSGTPLRRVNPPGREQSNTPRLRSADEVYSMYCIVVRSTFLQVTWGRQIAYRGFLHFALPVTLWPMLSKLRVDDMNDSRH